MGNSKDESKKQFLASKHFGDFCSIDFNFRLRRDGRKISLRSHKWRKCNNYKRHPSSVTILSVYSRGGETVLLIAEGDAVFGYNNTSNNVVNLPRGIPNPNYFFLGSITYNTHRSAFQPGVNENVLRLKVLAAFPVTWYLDNGQAKSNATQDCATITYQGRLSDRNAAANGQYDLQFQTFDTETGGTSQSGLITVENVQVTNGVFTVPLKFGSTFMNNFKARFLEIKVRPGAATGNDPFTTLTPRQPITTVPYAVNAQNASNATNATTTTTATTATNATQLGGVPAADYLTNSSNLGQKVTTAIGTGGLMITQTLPDYTLVPGLTQTVNVPANSQVLLTTDGGIFSSGAVNTFSVVDVALYVDGAAIAQRRIIISNNPLPASVGNWNISFDKHSRRAITRLKSGRGTA